MEAIPTSPLAEIDGFAVMGHRVERRGRLSSLSVIRRKSIDLLGIYGRDGTALGACAVERGFGAVALGFQGGGASPQDVVELNDAGLKWCGEAA